MSTLISILLGGGILAFIEFLIQRYDKKHDRFAALEKGLKDLVARTEKQDKDIQAITLSLQSIGTKVVEIDTKSDIREVENRRVRILRFEDELGRNVKHTKDSFDQVMYDIKVYRAYCKEHEDFENGKTGPTASHIESVYKERLAKHDFLPSGYISEEENSK